MWRDELEIWLIARDSASLGELLDNMGSQGHPALWYLVAFVVTRVTRDPLALQLLHLLIGTATAAVFLRWAPFPFWQRALFCFGYFPFYEYTIVTRSYGLEFLLVFFFCALFPRRERLVGWLVLILLLLAHTNLFGAILACSFTLLLAAEPLFLGRKPTYTPRVAASLALALFGIATSLGHILLQANRIGPAHRYDSAHDFAWVADCVSTVFYGWAPLPDPRGAAFWNTSILFLLPEPLRAYAGLGLGTALLLLSALVLRPKRPIFLAYVSGSAAMLGVVLFVWYGQLRQHGQFYLLFVACSWLAVHVAAPGRARPFPAAWAETLGRAAWIGVLVIHVAAGTYAWFRDFQLPFSNAAGAARFVERETPADAVIVGSVDYAVEPIAAYIDRPIYYPETKRFGTFMTWGAGRGLVPPMAALDAAVNFAKEGREVVMILSNKPDDYSPGQVVTIGDGLWMEYLTSFEGAIVHEENYFLFRISPPSGSTD